MRALSVAAFCLIILSGCAQTPPEGGLPKITFLHLKPLAVQAAAIQIDDRTAPMAGATHVEHRFPTPPKRAVYTWSRDRLRANATSGTLHVIIKQASAIEEKLEKTDGMKGFFTTDQSEKYTTEVHVRLELKDAAGNLKSFAEGQASRFITIAENASLVERERAWFDMVEKMMADFDAAIVANMRGKIIP